MNSKWSRNTFVEAKASIFYFLRIKIILYIHLYIIPYDFPHGRINLRIIHIWFEDWHWYPDWLFSKSFIQLILHSKILPYSISYDFILRILYVFPGYPLSICIALSYKWMCHFEGRWHLMATKGFLTWMNMFNNSIRKMPIGTCGEKKYGT